MCLLTYFSPNAQPDVQALRNGATTNDDGHGYAIICNGELIVGRSMSFEEVVEEFAALRAEYPDGPAMFHSRWGTCGAYGLENVHPFEVGKSEMTVVAHNGVLPQDAQPLMGDRRTDTRKFAQSIMPQRYAHLDSPKTRKRLEKWLGGGNKLVVLTVDPRYDASAYIFNEDAGIWTDTGIWYSNTGYLPSAYRYTGGKYRGGYTEAEWYGLDEQYSSGWGVDNRVWRKIRGTWRLVTPEEALRHDELIEALREWERADAARRDRGDDTEADEAEAYERWWRNRSADTGVTTGRKVGRYPAEGYDALSGTLFSDGVSVAFDSMGRIGVETGGSVDRLAIAAKSALECATCGYEKVDLELKICKACEYCSECNTHVTDCLCYDDDTDTGTGWPTVIGPRTDAPVNADLCETVTCAGFQLAHKCPDCSGCRAACFCGEDEQGREG